jgi:preprotein translocase subunit SecE
MARSGAMVRGLRERLHLGAPASREARPMPRAGRTAAKAAVPSENRFRRFIRETRSELKKVTWPTREQTTRLTTIVIAVSVAVGAMIGGVDFVFQQFFSLLLGAR